MYHMCGGAALLVLGALVLSGAVYDTARAEQDAAVESSNATVSLVVTTHNPACTAVHLDYLEVTRLTDVRPWYRNGTLGYTHDEITNGVNVTAVIWARDSNMTIPSILERPEVSSVATYSYIAPNSTEIPALLTRANNTGVIWPDMGLPTKCGTLRPHMILLVMDAVGWDGAESGTGPRGAIPANGTEPEPGGPTGQGLTDDQSSGPAAAGPTPLTLDNLVGERVDPESGLVYIGDMLGVEISAYNTTAVWEYLKENGALVTNVSPVRVESFVPPSLLGPLSFRDDVYNIVELVVDVLEEYGSTRTEGLLDENHPNVGQWHDLGHNGTGVRVGIIDLRFNLDTTTRNDLPDQADIACNSPRDNSGCSGAAFVSGTPRLRAHGMGVAEIVMDMAPGVDLYLYGLRLPTLDRLHSAVDWLSGQNVSVISMSMRYPFEGPGDGTSPVTNSALSAVDEAVRDDIVWVNSAGNYGNQQTWSTFDVQNVTEDMTYDNGSTRTITWVDFDPGPGRDTRNRVQDDSGPGNAFATAVEIRWSGGGELHLFQLDATSGLELDVADRRYNEGEPAKQIPRIDVDSDLRIRIDGDEPDWIQMMLYSGTNAELEHSTRDGGVNTPSDSANPGMLAVGAFDVTNSRNRPNYSSYGEHPTAGSPDRRDKPDIYGASHVTTDAYREWRHQFINPQTGRVYPQATFAGTSAAAPHVAGIAALVLGYHNNALTPAQTVAYLQEHMTAQDRIAGLPALEAPTPSPTTLHNNPFQQIVLETKDQVVHLGRVDSVYTMAMRWNVDAARWIATSSNTTVASIDSPRSLTPMRVVFAPDVWIGNVDIRPHNPGTTTIAVNITDGTVYRPISFDVTVTDNTHPAIHSIGPQHLNLTNTPHTIEFTAQNGDVDMLEWRYVLQNHTHFVIHTPDICETKGQFEECELPSNTLTLTPTTITGDNAILYAVYDGRGGNDIDAVDVYVEPNTSPVHGQLSDLTVIAGESATVQFRATDADGDAIIHLRPHATHIGVAETSIPYHTSNQELLEVPSNTTPAPGLVAESVSLGENGTVVSMSVLKETPSGNKLRYVINDTGGLPPLPESVVSTYRYERSPDPASANLTLTLTGLSPGNTTISSTVRDVWGGYDTQRFTVTVLSATPTITLAGTTNMTIPLNMTYVEPGYNATDYRGTDLTANVTITGMVDVNTIGTYTLQYDVTDSAGNPAITQNRTIYVVSNAPPVADAGPDQTVYEGATVRLNGTASDDGLTPLTYVWSQHPSAPAIPFGNVTDQATTFIAPSVDDTAIFTLTLTASDGNSTHFDSMNVTILDVPDPDSYFVTTWRTATHNESITVPVGGAAGSYTIHWGDDTISAAVTGSQTHTYATPGDHTIRISGDFSRIYLGGNSANAAKLVSIDQWGDTRWTTMLDAFSGVFNMAYNATDAPDLSQVTDMSGMFDGASSFNGNLSSWDVSQVTDMSGMFDSASSFNGDISGWNVSQVTDMSGMFSGASSFNQDISSWDVSRVVHMVTMFSGASSFNQDISEWDVSQAASMTYMFSGASSFRQNLGAWYVVPGSTIIEKGDAPGTVGSISAQNTFLDGQNPSYGIGTGGDSALFNITGSNLVLDTVPDKPTYAVNVTSTGDFGANNHLILDISVTGLSSNRPPMADAGPDQAVRSGATVTLNGTGSSDPDDDALSYMWSQTSGTAVALSESSAASPTFTAPAGNATLIFLLNVTDSGSLSATDAVTISVTAPANVPPAVSAGPDQVVPEGSIAYLNGTATDPDPDDLLTYLWTHDSTLAISLDNATAPSTRFTAPQVGSNTTITFTLAVTDNRNATASDSMMLTIVDVSEPPLGPREIGDVSLDSTEPGTVVASWSVPAEAPADYRVSWAKVGEPFLTWSDPAGNAYPTATSHTITDLEEGEEYKVRVRARYADNTSGPWSAEFIVAVASAVPANSPPMADAGPDQAVASGAPVTLDGTGSSDPDDGDSISHSWSQTSGTTVTLSNSSVPSPAFTAPAGPAVLVFELSVTDRGGLTSADSVNVTVAAPPNRTPVADAGPDQAVASGAPVTLDGTGSSDPDDGDSISHSWSQTSGTTVTLSNSSVPSPAFTAPAGPAVLVFELSVTDRGGLTSADSVNVTVAAPPNRTPVADAGPDQTVQADTLVVLDGTGSSDPDGDDVLSYLWRQTSGNTVTLSNSTVSSPTFTAPAGPALLAFLLNVTDGSLFSTDAVSVNVTAPPNVPPVLGQIGNMTVNEGSKLSFVVSATDGNPGDAVTYSVSGAPPGAAFDTATGKFSWTPAEHQGPGSYMVTFGATDGLDAAEPQTITITVNEVNQAPLFERSVREGYNCNAAVNGTVTLDFPITDSDLPAQALAVDDTSFGDIAYSAAVVDGVLRFNATIAETDGQQFPYDHRLLFHIVVADGHDPPGTDNVFIRIYLPAAGEPGWPPC